MPLREAPSIDSWSYENRQARREREAASLSKLQTGLQPLVADGSPQALAEAKALTNATTNAEAAANYTAQLRMRATGQAPPAAPVAATKKKGGGGLLGKLKDAAGDVAGGVADLGGEALHASMVGVNKVLSPIATAGQMVYAPLTGETSAGRHPVLDAQGNETGQFYRDAPDFRDAGTSLLNLFKDPIGEAKKGPQAFRERLANPEQNFVSRGILSAGSNPLTYVTGGTGAAVNIGANVGLEALNENADKIPVYRSLSPDAQQAIQLVAPVLAGKFGPKLLGKGARAVDDAAVALDAKINEPVAEGMGEAITAGSSVEMPKLVAQAKRDLVAANKRGIYETKDWAPPEEPREILALAHDRLASRERMPSGLTDAERAKMYDYRAAVEAMDTPVHRGGDFTPEQLASGKGPKAPETSALTPALTEPPIPEGMVRLYRGDGNSPHAPGASDAGRWFSPNRDVAVVYSATGDVSYVDVPRAVAEGTQVGFSRGQATRVHESTGLREEVLLPEEWAKLQHPLPDYPIGTGSPASFGQARVPSPRAEPPRIGETAPSASGGGVPPKVPGDVSAHPSGPALTERAAIDAFLAKTPETGKVPASEPYAAARDSVFADAINARDYPGAQTQSALRPGIESAQEAIANGQKLGYSDADIAAYLRRNYPETSALTPLTVRHLGDATEPPISPPHIGETGPNLQGEPFTQVGGQGAETGVPPPPAPDGLRSIATAATIEKVFGGNDGLPPVPPITEGAAPSPGSPPPGGALTAPAPFDLPTVTPGITKLDYIGNRIKHFIGVGTAEDPIASPVMRARARVKLRVNSQGARAGAKVDDLIAEAFPARDARGQITSLPGAPTVRDVAAAYPRYEPLLTPTQRAALMEVKAELEQYRPLLEEAGVTIEGSRPDVAAGGGFYIPRGKAGMEGADSPLRVTGRFRGVGSKKGFEKEAVFLTEAGGIKAGYAYPDVGTSVDAYVRDAGSRAIDQWATNYFKDLRDSMGQNIGTSYADRINPQIRDRYQGTVQRIASIRAKIATAEKRVGVATASSDELDTALEAFGLATPDAANSLAKLPGRMEKLRQRAEQLSTSGRSAGLTGLESDLAVAATPMERAQAAGKYTSDARAKAQARGIENAVNVLSDLVPDDVERLSTIETALRNSSYRLDKLLTRRDAASLGLEGLQADLARAQESLARNQPAYKQAIVSAKKSAGRDTGAIDFIGLTGRSFPLEMANAANKYIQAERGPMGRGAGILHTAEAFNQLKRGLSASMDVSFMGIQGILGAPLHPKAFGEALGVAFKSMADPNALGAYIRDFDARAVADGMPTSTQLAQRGLHIGGADTEFAVSAKGITRFGDTLAKGDIPGTKLNPIRGSNRAFGYFGDTDRIAIADAMLRARKAAGEPITDQLMEEATNAANHMTGWSPNSFGGSVGQLTQFAPRFFQSQLETVAMAVTKGGADHVELRRAMLTLLGSSVLITAGANAASPDGLKPEEWATPFKNGNPKDGFNPNFLRIRFGGHDTTLLGPWDSLLRGAITTALGDPGYVARSKASPVLGTAWDLLSGKTFDNQDVMTADYAIKSFLPFSMQNIDKSTLTPGGAAELGIGATGMKSVPLSPTEQLDQVANAEHGGDFYDLAPADKQAIKEAHPDLWQRAVERGNAQRQRAEAVRNDLAAKQEASDQQLLAGTMTREDWQSAMKARRDELKYRAKEIYGPSGPKNPKTALDRYYVAINAATDPKTDQVDWGQVDAWQAQQSPEDLAYIDKNSGLGGTAMVKLYRDLTKKYYDLPRYRGYTANQASDIDALVTEARNRTRDPNNKALVLAQLTRVAQEAGVDAVTTSGARKKLLGLLTETTDRTVFKKRHPAASLFLGKGTLTANDIAQIQAATSQAAG